MPSPPRSRWYQFSLRRMFVATVCFGVAFASAASAKVIFYDDPSARKWGTLSLVFAIIWFFPPFAAGIGAGIGTLCNRFWWGLLIGIVIGFMPYIGLSIWSAYA